ncbi:hypothetical protein L208DRAFT_243632 [Tricholoma matsutake]|nr:hypothetical protein L208DRAFT_243632 [Tricholoma matsutake 945]
MLTHRGFSAWIVADGETLPEYLVAVDNVADKVSCWIPSTEGQTFTVFWKDHGGKVDTCAFITLDGFVVPGRFLFGEGVASREGVRTSKTTERPFMFQNVDETEESPIDRVSGRPANTIQEIPQTISGKRKAGELRVGFGDERRAYEQYATTWSVKPHDVPGAKTPSTYVSFVFRYRSREFLESQGIIPESKVRIPTSIPKIPSGRRVISLPFANMPSMEVSGLSPPRKKPKLSSLSVGPYQLRRRSIEMRRTVSCKAPSDHEGHSVLGFVPFDEKTGKEGSMVKAESSTAERSTSNKKQ